MSIRPRRPSIRTAVAWGAQPSAVHLRPEECVNPSGVPVEAPATLESYLHYHTEASEKLTEYKVLLEDLYTLLDHGYLEEVKQVITDFDRSLPKLERITK